MILTFIGTTELILIVLVVLLLFGGKKLPELMRGLGRGISSFKQGMNEPASEQKESTRTEVTSPDEKSVK